MLVLHGISQCDVCITKYDGSDRVPMVIPCGHVFCRRCIASFDRSCCPLCRTYFEQDHLVRLRFDQGDSSSSSRICIGSDYDDPQVQREAKRLMTRIVQTVREGITNSEEFFPFIDECRRFVKAHPNEELRASYLLLHSHREQYAKLNTEYKQHAETRKERDELRLKMEQDRVESERKCKDLLRRLQDEQENARNIEATLRRHYEQLDGEWRQHYDRALAECRRLHAELERLESMHGISSSISIIPSVSEIRSLSIENPSKMRRGETPAMKTKGGKNDLGPQVVDIPPLLSTFVGFATLPPEHTFSDPGSESDVPSLTDDDVSPAGRVVNHTRSSEVPPPHSAPAKLSNSTFATPKALHTEQVGASKSLPQSYGIHSRVPSRPASPPARSSKPATPSAPSRGYNTPVPTRPPSREPRDPTPRERSRTHERSTRPPRQGRETEAWVEETRRAQLQDVLSAQATPHVSPTLARSASDGDRDTPRTRVEPPREHRRSSSRAPSSTKQRSFTVSEMPTPHSAPLPHRGEISASSVAQALERERRSRQGQGTGSAMPTPVTKEREVYAVTSPSRFNSLSRAKAKTHGTPLAGASVYA